MEMQEKQLEKLISETIPEIEEGTILKGKIISVMPDTVVVDIGYKSEGFIPIDEFSEDEKEFLKEGNEIEVFLSRIDSDGTVSLSIERVRRIKILNMLKDAQAQNTPVEVTIKERIKGGYRVDLGGVLGFMPGSHADIKPLKNPDEIVGQKAKVKVLKFNNKLTNIIVSRKDYLIEERERLKKETIKNLKEGARVRGIVKNIVDYGVFIDLGGIDGLLHVSDISWGRVRHPSDVFRIGQEVEVVVLKFDPETEKVTLGYKQKRPDPWLSAEDKYPVGRIVSGKVVSLTDYGAFVELEEGVEGLIHISEFEWSPRPKHPSHYVEIGDYIDAKVLHLDTRQRRISLGIKQLKPKPWELVAQRYKVGQKVTGRVRSITDFGAFVELPEGVDALLHVSDLSWTKHIRHPSEVLRKGQKIEAVILNLDPANERMSLGLKQLTPNPWEEEIPKRFHLGDEVKCRVLRITEYGIFVEIEDLVEGLIYSSEIEPSNRRPEEVYKEGDEVMARIIKLDLENQKIGLSMKNLKSVDYSLDNKQES
jgi:small subunit ribosomal protein S1